MNPYTHFYLYAKGWYKITEIVSDLKRITSSYSGIPEKHVTEQDITTILYEILQKEISKNNYILPVLLSRVVKDGLYRAIIDVLSIAEIKDCGRPDSSILPFDDYIREKDIEQHGYNWSN